MSRDVESIVRARRVCRSFDPAPLDRDRLIQLLDAARRAPSAGATRGVSFVVADTRDARDRYWSSTLADRDGFRWPGLLAAPCLVLVLVRPDAWVERYAEADKARTGMGEGPDRWPVPYWWVDAGMVTQNLLLLAEAEDWGGLIFGQFEHEPAVHAAFDIPDGWRSVATVALGYPSRGPLAAGASDGAGTSAAADSSASKSVRSHPLPPVAEIVHFDRF